MAGSSRSAETSSGRISGSSGSVPGCCGRAPGDALAEWQKILRRRARSHSPKPIGIRTRFIPIIYAQLKKHDLPLP